MATNQKSDNVMYIGEYAHAIDSKNRVFLPARFRRKKKEFILTRGLETCLFLYDIFSWGKVMEKLEGLSLANKLEQRAFKRALLSGAYECVPDFQGRILLPQNLRQYAKIKNEIMIVGVGSRLEIWDRLIWNKYLKEHANVSFRSLASKLEL